MRKIVSMNLMPERVRNLESTIPSLSTQSDIFHVNLVGFDDIPPILTEYDNIIVEKFDKVGAEYKFFHYNKYNNEDDFYFTVDDDIYYPEDYCESHVKYQLKNERSITCVHGTVIDLKINKNFHYPFNRKEYYNFQNKLEQSKWVDVPGTGTLCIRGDILNFDMSDFQHRNMDDHWIAVFAKKQNISILCIPRDSKWMIALNEGGVSIWGSNPHHIIDKLVHKYFK